MFTWQTDSESNRLNRLQRAIMAARAAIGWEMIWPRLVPVLTVLGLFVALSWFGLWRLLPDVARIGALVLFAAALVYGLSRFIRLRLPDEPKAVHRVEVNSGYEHRPASGLRDTLSAVSNDPAAQALWSEHRKRQLAQLQQLRIGAPQPDMVNRDPNAWRFAVPILLIAAFFVASGEHLLRIGEAFSSTADRTIVVAPDARIDAWIDPPPYTRQPPVFLTRQGTQTERAGIADRTPDVPENSVLTVRVVAEETPIVTLVPASGDELALSAAEDADNAEGDSPEAATAEAVGGNTIHVFTTRLATSGSVRISHSTGAEMHAFTVTDDAPPTIVSRDADMTRVGSFTLDYDVADDYGVVSGALDLNLKDPPAADARPLVELPSVPLRLSRPNAREGTARAYVRLGDHPFAGLSVTVDATVVDGAEQVGRPDDEMAMDLPRRAFFNPLARALVEERQQLALDANNRHRVADALDAMMIAPDEFLNDSSIYLGLRIGYKRLLAAADDDQLRDILDYLWTMALQIEDGALSDAEQRLAEARRALEEALERGASDEEIARLTEELRQAMNEFLQSMAEEMARLDNQNLPQVPIDPSQMMTQQDFQDMLQRIEDLAKLGDHDAAQQLLSELQQMLDNLQMARRGQQMQNGMNSQMMQQLDELGRLMREQQRLMDDTFRLDQGQRPRQRGEQGQQGQQGEQGPLSPSELAELLKQLQEGQSDLHEGLQALLDQLREGQQGQQPGNQQGQQQGQQQGGQQPGAGQRALDRAGRAMGNATGQLGEGETGQAYGSQGEALQALREGLESMMQQMFGNQQGQQQQAGRGRPRGRMDPLGRPQRTEGPDFGQDVRVPDEIDVQRAREILNAIRERLGERYRPQFELEYLERLLRNE